jgi:hypothetical protein
MAQMTITIADEHVTRVITALCVTGGKSPINAANAREVVREWVRTTTLAYERREAERVAVAGITPPTDPGIT